LTPGESATAALPVTKIPKVRVAFASVVVATLGPTAEMHCPVAGLVWHRLIDNGRLAVPASALAVIDIVPQ
jgi:hypothetical protein